MVEVDRALPSELGGSSSGAEMLKFLTGREISVGSPVPCDGAACQGFVNRMTGYVMV